MTNRIPYERAVQVGGPPLSIAIGTIALLIARALSLGPGTGAQITHIEHVVGRHLQTTSIAAPGDSVAQAIFSIGVFVVSALVPHLTNLKWLDGSIKWAQLSAGAPTDQALVPSAPDQPGDLPTHAEELASQPTHISPPEPRSLRNDPGTATPVQAADSTDGHDPAPDEQSTQRISAAPIGDPGVGQ